MIANANALRLPYATGSMHMVTGSPPYWGGIRKYNGEQGTDWPEVTYSPMPGLEPIEIPAQRVELGHEPDPFAYIGHLLLVYREAGRVLREDGINAVNMGDAMSTDGRARPQGKTGQRQGRRYPAERGRATEIDQPLPSKNLLLMPARLALAMQADGWILRSRMPGGVGMHPAPIWRSNKMPESVKDRPSKDFEDILILSKGPRYFWDQEAGREPSATFAHHQRYHSDSRYDYKAARASGKSDDSHGGLQSGALSPAGRNMRAAWTPEEAIERAPMREMWTISSEPTNLEHFAAWPTALAARLISVGTSERGCCPECGAQWVRQVERFRTLDGERCDSLPPMKNTCTSSITSAQGVGHWRTASVSNTTGWAPSCDHRVFGPVEPPVPCRVLDPFTGIGRTWSAAKLLGRQFFGADLALEYCLTSRRRCGAGLPAMKRVDVGQASLFEGVS